MSTSITTFFTDFWKEAKKEWASFRDYCRKHGGFLLCLCLFVIFTYGIRLVNDDLFVDSELMFQSPKEVMKSQLGGNRFGLVVTRYLFGFLQFVPYTSNLMFLLCLMALGIFLSYCVYTWAGGEKNRRFRIFAVLFPIFFLSGPCFAEQFIFTLQAFEVSFGMLLALLGTYFLGQVIYEKKHPLWFFLSLPCMVWAIASYQAITALLITFLLICFFLYYTELETDLPWIKAGFSVAGSFLLALVLYFLCGKLLQIVTHTEVLSGYVSGQFKWSMGISPAIHAIIGEFHRVYENGYNVYHASAKLLAFCFLILAGKRILCSKKKAKWAGLFSVMLLLIAPLFLTIATGFYQQMRAQLTYPLAFAFWGSYLTTLALPSRESAISAYKRIPSLLLTAACLGITLQQANLTVGLFETAHMVSKNELLLLNRIYGRVEQVADDESMHDHKVIFLGSIDPIALGNMPKGDVIGHTFFDWDSAEPLGINGRMSSWAKVVGMPFAPPTVQDIETARAEADSHASWPASDSVWNIGDMTVVKLSGESQ